MTTARDKVFFYSFVFGAVLIAFYSGYRLGRTMEKQQWEKTIMGGNSKFPKA